jgi:hypothetical protein
LKTLAPRRFPSVRRSHAPNGIQDLCLCHVCDCLTSTFSRSISLRGFFRKRCQQSGTSKAWDSDIRAAIEALIPTPFKFFGAFGPEIVTQPHRLDLFG